MKARSKKEEARRDEANGSYEHCLKQERDRERKWRMSRQGAFVSSMQSFDALMETFEDPSSIRIFSDRGRGAEAINSIDSSDEEVIADALSRLDEPDRDFAQAVLNGMTWQTSGLTRQGFNWKLRSIIKKILLSTPPQKGRFKN